MGGFGSGRVATQPVVETALRLDLGDLMRRGYLLPGCQRSGISTWSNSLTGERVAAIGIESDLRDASNAWVRLRYATTTDDGIKTTHDYRVPMTTSVPPFGGMRWWFVCPRTGRLATTLYLPPGAKRFASRRAFRMAFRSQRDKPLYRAQAREARVVRKLGATYERPDTPRPPRPKWMRQRTYARLCTELAQSQAAQDVAFLADGQKFMERVERTARRRTANYDEREPHRDRRRRAMDKLQTCI